MGNRTFHTSLFFGNPTLIVLIERGAKIPSTGYISEGRFNVLEVFDHRRDAEEPMGWISAWSYTKSGDHRTFTRVTLHDLGENFKGKRPNAALVKNIPDLHKLRDLGYDLEQIGPVAIVSLGIKHLL